ncbi:MAG: creatininase family protein [Armatimonadetes bacterium]|nr:creatininase family protein [Armatimonadota bacterium]
MRIEEMNWQMVERRAAKDDRCVLPLGCTEQHAYLSLATDSILAYKVSVDAASPLGVPVFPVMPFGVTPSFTAYPGTVSLKLGTYSEVLCQLLDSLEGSGFGRILVVNGHGGNTPARSAVAERAARSGQTVVWHDWWCAPRVWTKVQETDPDASHANWMENFPWTRLEGVEQPAARKPMVEVGQIRTANPGFVREVLGDGSFGGLYQRADDEMAALWAVAVEETRELLVNI